jgi:hypothetical protein
MVNTREDVALNAYIKFLTGKGVAPAQLHKRQVFLKTLVQKLENKDLSRAEYATALNAMLKKAKEADWAEQISFAREFYPFLMQDIKAIALLNESYGLELKTEQWTPAVVSLDSLTEVIKNHSFSEPESLMLERYMQLLQSQTLAKSDIAVRLKLAKLVLIRLREAPVKNGLVYRAAVDVTWPLFQLKESRQTFLAVIREFFNIWMSGA